MNKLQGKHNPTYNPDTPDQPSSSSSGIRSNFNTILYFNGFKYTLNQLLYACEKYSRGSQETQCRDTLNVFMIKEQQFK